MRRHVTTRYRLIDLMLVLALVLAPMQGAWCAFGSLCHHGNGLTAAHRDYHPENMDIVHTSHAGGCDCHTAGQSGNSCSDSCQSAPIALYLPSLGYALCFPVHSAYEEQQPGFNYGLTLPPPYHPPRS